MEEKEAFTFWAPPNRGSKNIGNLFGYQSLEEPEIMSRPFAGPKLQTRIEGISGIV